MSIIISDKDKLIQDLGKRMTKVTDVYSTTHVVVHWGDVQEIVEKFFIDKNSDWLMAKTEPSNSEIPNNYEPQTEYKKWETKPNADRLTVNTTCVGVAMALIEDELQTEKGVAND